MYKTCPKCGHTRQPNETDETGVCPACGLVFKKYFQNRLRQEMQESGMSGAGLNIPKAGKKSRKSTQPRFWLPIKTMLLHVPKPVEPLVFYACCMTYLLFFIWGWQFILMDYAYYQINTRIDDPMPEIFQSFMHNINLVFHEAGHVIFSLFGYFMMMLGGSLFQVLVPLMVCGVFLLREHKPFSASIGLWWTAQSLMDIAPYINDARNGQIILLGGTTGAESTGYHDWETLLLMMGLMEYDHLIADAVDSFAVFLMLLAFAWGAAILFKQYSLLHKSQL